MDCKPISGLMVVAQYLSSTSLDFDYPSFYRSLVGAL